MRKNKGACIDGNPERPILKFQDNEKVSRIPNEYFPLVIIATIANFYMSRILINKESSWDIMYVELFEKIGLKREKL